MRRPHIVFIVADDLGFADLGCYGGRVPVSPVLDRMAAEGIRFRQGYANSPVCSPTRFALMTGRYQYRLRGAAEEPISSRSRGSTTLGLPPEHPTLPSLLRAAGYRTALAGKWHLGYPPAFGPLRSEFLKAVNSREVRQQLVINGMYPVGDGPDALLKTMRDDTERWGRIMRATHFSASD